MIGALCTGLSKFPEDVRRMAWVDALDLLDYWQEYPPTHLLMRGYVGYKYKPVLVEPTAVEQAALNQYLNAGATRPLASMPDYIRRDMEELLALAEQNPDKKAVELDAMRTTPAKKG